MSHPLGPGAPGRKTSFFSSFLCLLYLWQEAIFVFCHQNKCSLTQHLLASAKLDLAFFVDLFYQPNALCESDAETEQMFGAVTGHLSSARESGPWCGAAVSFRSRVLLKLRQCPRRLWISITFFHYQHPATAVFKFKADADE